MAWLEIVCNIVLMNGELYCLTSPVTMFFTANEVRNSSSIAEEPQKGSEQQTELDMFHPHLDSLKK